MYLERCCGKHSWLGRPEALEPGVLTDCDLVWWGDPYLNEANINNSPLTRERNLLVKKKLFSHNKSGEPIVDVFQMFPFTDKHNYRNSIHEIRRQMEDDGEEEHRRNPILPYNLIWMDLHDEKHLARRSS